MKIYLLFFVFILSSCAQQHDVVVDNVEFSTSFIAQGKSKLDTRWWQSFENKELSQLISQGLQENLSLKARELRLKSNAIDMKISGTAYYPNLNLSSNASSKFNDLGDINTASFGVSSSWELDIWGSMAAREKKSLWEYKGQQALYRARANLVAGNVATTWLSLVSEHEKKLVLAHQFQRTKDALTVILRRFSMGKNSVTNIWQQQKLLKSIEVQQARNHADIYIYQQSLALWLGKPITELTNVALNNLPALPPLPEIGIPAEVLKYRPDIKQAFAKIQSANENLSVAVAAQYPRITLRANYSTAKNSTEALFDDWKGNLIASLAMPLFDAGKNRLIVEQRKLAIKALMLEYQQVWLEAIASVNQVLINEAQLLKVAKNLASQLELAERTEKLTTIKYLNGKTTYLNLLNAQESILSLERQLIDANKKLVINRVLLYRELSHGDFSLDKEVNTTINLPNNSLINTPNENKGTQP